jgi:hypothetical protein
MSAGSSIFLGIMVLIFVAVAALTFYYISTKIGHDDNSKDVGNAIKTIAFANTVLIIALGLISYIFINNNGSVPRAYTVIMLHITLLFSMTAVSIASIEKFT